jgi:hypothetical protein
MRKSLSGRWKISHKLPALHIRGYIIVIVSCIWESYLPGKAMAHILLVLKYSVSANSAEKECDLFQQCYLIRVVKIGKLKMDALAHGETLSCNHPLKFP